MIRTTGRALACAILALTGVGGVSAAQVSVSDAPAAVDGVTVTPSPKIASPGWVRKPTGDDMGRYYPRKALIERLQARVVMKCMVTASGTLEACEILDENPSGQGFGPATLNLAHLFKMKDKTADGQSVEGAVVTLPISWRTH
ncbi:MAG TPA: energy transducer TonB [Caulobacteraceae bacterium]|jgi:hypothetical protein